MRRNVVAFVWGLVAVPTIVIIFLILMSWSAL